MMSNGSGIFVDFVKEEFVSLVFCLKDVCVDVLKILWKLRGVQRNDCAGKEKGYKKIQVRKYHAFDSVKPCNIIALDNKIRFFRVLFLFISTPFDFSTRYVIQ